MDLYTMNENFIPNPDGNIDEFQSVIWTERYYKAGEVQLVVPALPRYLDLLREGTYLGLAGTDEVMELKTDSIEDGLMTVVGKTMLERLDDRIHWPRTTDDENPIADYTTPADIKLGELISDRVDKMVINPVPFPAATVWSNLNLDWERDKIPNLELGAIDHGGEAKRWTVPVGPLYPVVSDLAEKDGLGLSLYLESADADLGFKLKFKTYRGVDRTSSQTAVPLLRLSPDVNALGKLKELRSIDGYKNVVYVVYKNQISIHYEDPANIPEGLDRRVMIRDAEGEPVGTQKDWRYGAGDSARYPIGGYYGGSYNKPVVGPADIAKFREQNAKDALANHNYIKQLDGQVEQGNSYIFGKDYGMGDVLELESLTGIVSKARVTEYIRAQDRTGKREYPTLSVIDD